MGAPSVGSAHFSDAAVLGGRVQYNIVAGREVVRKTIALLKALNAVPRAEDSAGSAEPR